MTPKINRALLAGLLGAASMSLFNMIVALIGLPKLSPPVILSSMMKLPAFAGWILHAAIGIIFAFTYALFFYQVVRKIDNLLLKGAIFGVAAFIVGQIGLAALDALMGGMPPTEGSVVVIMILSLAGHIIFGIVVAMVIDKQTASNTPS